jgi:hypothetical protein
MLGAVAGTPCLIGNAHAAATRRTAAPAVAAPNGGTSLRGCCLRDPRLSRKLLAQSRLGLPGGSTNTESSGDARFDRALGTLLADLAGRFQVRPGFGWYDDGAIPNALALEASHLSNSRGTVLVGREMLRRGLSSVHGDMFILGVCAHEFAHIVQFFSVYHARLASGQAAQKLVELHADFLSGYYIGLRQVAYTDQELVALGRTWETLGDSAYTDQQHHGTPDERLRAIEAGFAFARERPEFGITPACEVGARYLRA